MPNQEVQEQQLKAAIENDDQALSLLAQKHGAIDSEALAADLQDAGTYFDPETPRRIQEVLARRDRRLQTAAEIQDAQLQNAAEDGTGHGYKGKGT